MHNIKQHFSQWRKDIWQSTKNNNSGTHVSLEQHLVTHFCNIIKVNSCSEKHLGIYKYLSHENDPSILNTINLNKIVQILIKKVGILVKFYSFTSWESRLWVAGLLSLFSSTMCRKRLLGTSLTICHWTGNWPFHLSCCQYSASFSKSTGPTISATPQNCPLALTCTKKCKQIQDH